MVYYGTLRYTHARIHTHAYIHTDTYTRIHTHAYIHIRTHKDMRYNILSMLYMLQYALLSMYFQSSTYYAYVCMHTEAVVSGTTFVDIYIYVCVAARLLLMYHMYIVEFTSLYCTGTYIYIEFMFTVYNVWAHIYALVCTNNVCCLMHIIFCLYKVFIWKDILVISLFSSHTLV